MRREEEIKRRRNERGERTREYVGGETREREERGEGVVNGA